tara:strand:+ start:208 stop:483 length:276 start_codon:yes stop_codon:yes gene_type:complete
MKHKSITAQYEQSYLAWYKHCFKWLGLVIFDSDNYKKIVEIVKTLFMFLFVVVLFVTFPVNGFILAWFVRRSFKKQHEKFYNETLNNKKSN